MVDKGRLQQVLPVAGLGEPLHLFESIGSTNDFAKQLAGEGAQHGALVIADEQTAGRGQHGRAWITPAASALALSLVLRPPAVAAETAPRLNGLAALALCQALEAAGAQPRIKWPNDVLIHGKKVAGILVEPGWQGDRLVHAIVGIGVNVLSAAEPAQGQVDFPATSLESALGRRLSRVDLLQELLQAFSDWLNNLAGAALIEQWQSRLAYLGKKVRATQAEKLVEGLVLGLTPAGGLRLDVGGAQPMRLDGGLWRLRPVDSDKG